MYFGASSSDSIYFYKDLLGEGKKEAYSSWMVKLLPGLSTDRICEEKRLEGKSLAASLPPGWSNL